MLHFTRSQHLEQSFFKKNTTTGKTSLYFLSERKAKQSAIPLSNRHVNIQQDVSNHFQMENFTGVFEDHKKVHVKSIEK